MSMGEQKGTHGLVGYPIGLFLTPATLKPQTHGSEWKVPLPNFSKTGWRYAKMSTRYIWEHNGLLKSDAMNNHTAFAKSPNERQETDTKKKWMNNQLVVKFLAFLNLNSFRRFKWLFWRNANFTFTKQLLYEECYVSSGDWNMLDTAADDIAFSLHTEPTIRSATPSIFQLEWCTLDKR